MPPDTPPVQVELKAVSNEVVQALNSALNHSPPHPPSTQVVLSAVSGQVMQEFASALAPLRPDPVPLQEALTTASDAVTQPPRGEDKRLDRIQSYTNFHIGLYAALFGAVIGYLKPNSHTDPEVLWWLNLSCGLLLMAGAMGGVIAANVTVACSYDHFIDMDLQPRPLKNNAPWRLKYGLASGLEHLSFWAGVFALVKTIIAATKHGEAS